jgi:hypothetical protein
MGDWFSKLADKLFPSGPGEKELSEATAKVIEGKKKFYQEFFEHPWTESEIVLELKTIDREIARRSTSDGEKGIELFGFRMEFSDVITAMTTKSPEILMGFGGEMLEPRFLATEELHRLKDFLELKLKDIKTKPVKDRQEQKLDELRAHQQFKAQEEAIKLFGMFQTRIEIDKEYERQEAQIMKGRRLGDLSKEELVLIQDLKDARQFALDKL